MTWLMFYEPDPQIITLDESDPEASANLQDTARTCGFRQERAQDEEP